MGSDTCLQRSLGSLHGLHQSKTQPLSRDPRQEGANKQANKYIKEILSLKQLASPLISNTVPMSWLQLGAEEV